MTTCPVCKRAVVRARFPDGSGVLLDPHPDAAGDCAVVPTGDGPLAFPSVGAAYLAAPTNIAILFGLCVGAGTVHHFHLLTCPRRRKRKGKP